MNKNCLISVIGSHAGESIESIFCRKIKDIQNIGETFWLINSYLANPIDVQVNGFDGMPVFFIEPSVSGGSKDTKVSSVVKKYSVDGINWENIRSGISDITGRINKGTSCLILSSIDICEKDIDLSHYKDINGTYPLQFKLGASTAVSLWTGSESVNKIRKVVAIGKLKYPYSVFVSK